MINSKIKKILSKKNKSKIVCLTAYSKNMAEILDKHCDIILVGDSLGSVLYGMKSTREVSLNMMINHTKSVKQGVKKSLLVVDMPYKTYQNKNQALKNVKKVVQSTKCDAVKLEGGKKIIKIIKHLTKNKIAVMGHLGLLPQTQKGKFRYKGKSVTKTCPSQYFDDPIPIVGILILFVIIFDKLLSTHSNTMENTPAVESNMESS